jgi:hypothetical protein
MDEQRSPGTTVDMLLKFFEDQGLLNFIPEAEDVLKFERKWLCDVGLSFFLILQIARTLRPTEFQQHKNRSLMSSRRSKQSRKDKVVMMIPEMA